MASLAVRQHGVVSASQLSTCGLSKDAISGRVQAGRLHRVHRGVYTAGDPLLTQHGRWMAAVLASGEGAVLSHAASAGVWRLLRPTSRIDVTVPTRTGRRERKGITVHRSAVEPYEVTRRERIPVTTPARTLLDLASVLARRQLERAADEAEHLRLFDLAAVKRVLGTHPGHPGAGRLSRLLAQHSIGTTLTRSELEEHFLELCRKHDLPPPAVNARVEGYEVDFLWRDERLVVETDGRGAHGTRASFEHDRARDARLTVAGYRVVRFTHRQVVSEPDVVARVLRSLLGGRSTLRS